MTVTRKVTVQVDHHHQSLDVYHPDVFIVIIGILSEAIK